MQFHMLGEVITPLNVAIQELQRTQVLLDEHSAQGKMRSFEIEQELYRLRGVRDSVMEPWSVRSFKRSAARKAMFVMLLCLSMVVIHVKLQAEMLALAGVIGLLVGVYDYITRYRVARKQ